MIITAQVFTTWRVVNGDNEHAIYEDFDLVECIDITGQQIVPPPKDTFVCQIKGEEAVIDTIPAEQVLWSE